MRLIYILLFWGGLLLAAGVLAAIAVNFLSFPGRQLAPFPSPDIAEDLRRQNEQTYTSESKQMTTIGSIPYWDQEAAIASFKARPEMFDYITVFWYALRPDGSVAPYPYATVDQDLIDFAHSYGVKVLALVANLPGENEGDDSDWDASRVGRAIALPRNRTAHVEELAALGKAHNFDGIVIDYERLKPEQRDVFTEFIAELGSKLHQEGRILQVALHPRPAEAEKNPIFDNGYLAQDWAALARHADQLTIMTFEEHWSESEPGAAASIPWVYQQITYARQLIPADKLFLGTPLYGYDWGPKPLATGLTYAEVEKLISQHEAEIEWDSRSQSNFFTYEAEDGTHEIWFEDAMSFMARLRLYRDLGVRNMMFWRLGGEDHRVWQVLLIRH